MKAVNKLLCVSNRLYTLFKKSFLLLYTALLKCFIYSIIKASYILHDATIPVEGTKN